METYFKSMLTNIFGIYRNNYIAGDNFTPVLRLSSSKAVLGLQKGGSGVRPKLKVIDAACRPAIDEFCERIDEPDAPALQTRWAPSHDEGRSDCPIIQWSAAFG